MIEPRPAQRTQTLATDADARAEVVARDPVTYLRQVASECQKLEQYTLRFTRYERRGLFALLYGPEHIDGWFRRDPFSVRLKWLDEDLKYYESTYVAGEANGKVRFVTRWWSPPLKPPPGVNLVDLQTPVTWGESKRPLTDFGLERLMERTLASMDEAGDEVVVTYEGLVRLPETGEVVHHLHLAYASTWQRVPIQELYIDPQTDLPVGTVLKFASGTLDAAYFYEDVNPGVQLTDADFLLESERAALVDDEAARHDNGAVTANHEQSQD